MSWILPEDFIGVIDGVGRSEAILRACRYEVEQAKEDIRERDWTSYEKKDWIVQGRGLEKLTEPRLRIDLVLVRSAARYLFKCTVASRSVQGVNYDSYSTECHERARYQDILNLFKEGGSVSMRLQGTDERFLGQNSRKDSQSA
jgi:hypothetical protein